MLQLLSRIDRNCEGQSRRNFLQVGTLAGLGLSLPHLLQSTASGGVHRGKDTNCILIWTRGGTSHHDTFDPKPNAPVSVRGEFNVIDTAVPGIQFTEIVPNLAKNLHRFGLLRSWNPENGSHGHADQFAMSGRKFSPALHYPTYGSVVSWHHGFKSAMPPFVQLGSQVDRRFGGGSAGLLGLQNNPFEVLSDPNADKFSVRDISLPNGVTMDRIGRRQRMLTAIDELQQQVDLQPEAFDALDEHYRAALNMITAPETKKAFDLPAEEDSLREKYGRHRFGQSCLLARRLVQSGVRFVTVTDGGWDTHQNNFKSLKDSRLPPIDQALPALLEDLQDQGMLESTLVVWLTDFGRTPNVNSASGRDHWSSAGFAIMAGAGVPGGSVIGATDEEGGKPIRDEYKTASIAATIYEKLGLPLDLMTHAPDGRPVRLIEGEPIQEWI